LRRFLNSGHHRGPTSLSESGFDRLETGKTRPEPLKMFDLATSFDDLQAIIDVIPNPVFVKNREHRIVLVNTSACDMFKRSREYILSHTDEDMFPAEQVATFRELDNRLFETGQDTEMEAKLTDGSGVLRTIVTRKRRVRLSDGAHIAVGVATDVTAFREAEAHNRYLAFHDPLTGLPNRVLLHERIDHALNKGMRKADQCALLYIDLDRFKGVNDSFGHLAGDELIRDFAARLSGLVRGTDTVARLGGDEFAVLLNDLKDQAEIERVCDRILAAARRPFEIGGAQVYIGGSIGVVFTSDEELGRIELQRRADVALYESKKAGRGCFRIFTSAMDEQIQRHRLIEAELRCALVEDRGLDVHYQPLIASLSGRAVAMEALVRWNHPRLGMLNPAQFLQVAEDSGLIAPLGEWVLARACRVLREWTDLGVAVNVSPTQLRDADFADRVLAILAETRLPPERLQLEITETAILNVDDLGSGALEQLRSAGVKIALDDFGTGYSSLNHLRKLHVDKVKIDRSFVQHIGQLADTEVIVQAVTSLGRTLGLSVVAEGVETDEQRQFLCATGCNELQGYLLSRPMPETEAIVYLQRQAAPLVA